MGGGKEIAKMSRKIPATAIIILGKIYHLSIKVLMVVCVLLTWMIHKSMIRIVCFPFDICLYDLCETMCFLEIALHAQHEGDSFHS